MESVIYLSWNMLRIYSIYILIDVFLKRKDIKRGVVFLAYAVFFAVNSFLYLCFDSYLVNIVSNIVPIFIITFLYESRIWKKIFVSILIYTISMFWECILYVFFNAVHIKNLVIVCGFASSIMMFLTALFFKIQIKQKFRLEAHIKAFYYLMLIYIPLGSIIIGYLTMPEKSIGSLVIGIILLFINFLIFYLFDEIIKSYMRKQEAESIKQNKLYFQHELEVMQKSQLKMDFLRHDMKNHFIRIEGFAKENNVSEILNYVEQGRRSLISEEGYVITGNKSVDCILNYKLDEASQKNITFSVNAVIPDNLKISAFDLSTILGNILDNAIEAAAKSSDKKIDVSINYNKNTLAIIIINTFDGKINKNFETTKSNPLGHGLGLKSVKITAEKYNGLVEYDYNNMYFTTKILLYDE